MSLVLASLYGHAPVCVQGARCNGHGLPSLPGQRLPTALATAQATAQNQDTGHSYLGQSLRDTIITLLMDTICYFVVNKIGVMGVEKSKSEFWCVRFDLQWLQGYLLEVCLLWVELVAWEQLMTWQLVSPVFVCMQCVGMHVYVQVACASNGV